MAEVGEETCQAEVGHYANRGPEYFCSRPEKHVHFYKKALGLTVAKKKKPMKVQTNEASTDGSTWGTGISDAEEEKVSVQKSDLELYESRVWYAFAEGTPVSELLPVKGTPEAQVADACAFDFFRLVRYRGGTNPYLE